MIYTQTLISLSQVAVRGIGSRKSASSAVAAYVPDFVRNAGRSRPDKGLRSRPDKGLMGIKGHRLRRCIVDWALNGQTATTDHSATVCRSYQRTLGCFGGSGKKREGSCRRRRHQSSRQDLARCRTSACRGRNVAQCGQSSLERNLARIAPRLIRAATATFMAQNALAQVPC
jgi:hypothetical protein